ncbi:hormogonium polysaccharide biosynthesis protein HpsA [Thermosynechococcus sp. JY1334]|uniref:hormogonium polysaccharide biosynthesis protein HpsA n=1 Tax=unclassified Thermosynechococcus TaxID=2622553 RepID=UPI002672A9C7|nr:MULTISPECIES: hormogonium polysaccharide biosynthesis protein HpsA [unclassified Thermosynechococcus]MDR7898309.1 hormogonium polysaccharide biosynthesis protein HpsA [Thermosynechococcus sp. JY1332]MDR7905710.1 hormogonium polysaccharide biosynthesis protein HpsA [Thermosynechococcus sp. JY1334]WKT85447.1 hormogonium polysaccharide biosynthesis protein HpsA [Thermosynechococcus sp. JY1339]WNC54393.1 hormogonium polysaccharide biosynthesis protein HpsA [Thermosynechococcus sp. JY1331]
MKKNDRRFGLSKRQYRKLTQAIRHLLYQLRLWIRRRLAPLGRGGRQLQFGRRGFVLPTVIIVILVLTITVGALMLRTLNRTTQVAGERQDIQVLNAATPAIDRAKAKLEYLFTRDPRRPSGVPGEDRLRDLMLNVGANPDPYTLADEQRIDINGDGNVDNAWVFQPTPNSIVAYSILMTRPNNTQINQSDAQKAAALVTRNRPLNISEMSGQCASAGGVAAQTAEAGWDSVGTASLRKNFQVNAFVYENRNGGQALATLDFVQERELDRGNKWGAWFRNDLEIFPGPAFRWNGAMHTEGSIFMGGGSSFSAFLVSAPSSCIYTRAASEITTAQVPDTYDFDNDGNTSEPIFQGQFISGTLRDNTISGRTTVHSYRESPALPFTTGDNDPPGQNVIFNGNRDSVVSSVNQPAQLALNPVLIVTEDRSRSRASDTSNASYRDPNWVNQFYGPADSGGTGRFSNQQVSKPYVDDTYRADDRYGPKPIYANVSRDALENDPAVAAEFADRVIPSGSRIGDQIPSSNQLLLRNTVPESAEADRRTEVGLDGYWERRARQEGLRIIVGERLELGKPLDPPAGDTADNDRRNEFYQHRTLRDDLAAVQATAIYHYKARGTTVDSTIPDPFTEPYPGQNTGGYEPIACLATTHHHGTPQTALRSIMFNQYSGIPGLSSDFRFFDFFTGRGTNGWEFEPPNFNSLTNPNDPMRKAMKNLVAYASDGVDGAFPPKQEIGGTQIHPRPIHPHPKETRAGNFSNLARALQLLDQRGSLSALSLADQSTIHTAGCMLGMLAHSVDTLNQNLNLNLSDLNNAINAIDNKVTFDSDSGAIKVDRNGAEPLRYRGGYLNPDAYITALIPNARWSQRPLQETNADVNARLARLIALTEQVKYDLNPQGYTCEIPNQYSNLRNAFCLGQDKRGFVIGEEFKMPRAGDTVIVNLEDAPSYNFDLRKSDKGKVVYVTGAGWMTLEDFEPEDFEADDHGKILKVKLKNLGVLGNATGSIPAGASAWIITPPNNSSEDSAGTISVAVPFPNNPNNSTLPITITYTLTPQLQVEDIVAIRSPINNRIEGIFVVIESPTSNTATLRYIGGTERTGTGTTPIAVDSTLVVLKRQGDSDLPLGTFNTVIKYPALRAIFNPQGTLNLSEILNGIRAIAANPRMNPTNFLTPTEPATGTLVNNIRYPSRLNQIIGFDGNARNVAFLDNTLFNGREEMAVREMDIDLDLLRRTSIGGDTWLPMGGIVYAFREDAVREDGIARPAITGQNWMNTNPSNPHDPIRAANGISTKPVDFFADPMRRPNGFRLWNGRRLDRQGIPAEKNIAGLSFISDNPVYIQGNFNLHSTNGTTNNLEEFTTTLDANWSNFYSRDTLDNRFARPNSDTWRPAEILGDAVTILSDNFCNGSANDYFAEAYNDDIQRLDNNSPENLATNYVQNTGSGARVNNGNNPGQIYLTCANNANLRTSFLNANRPSDDLPNNNTVWLRESPFDPSSPIYVDRNGTPWAINYRTGERVDRDGKALTSYPDGEQGQASNPYNSYYGFGSQRSRNAATDTQVNAVIISGTVPSRPTQSYGGMHNFPRFIEAWNNLWIQGAFIQLNFSTQATGPFDQDQWEVPNTAACRDVNTAFNCAAQDAEWIRYYSPPNRRWGYDVGLQLAPAGPVASRFITPARQRSEYYRELPADDPYILRLRCAPRPEGGGTVDPSVTGCP